MIESDKTDSAKMCAKLVLTDSYKQFPYSDSTLYTMFVPIFHTVVIGGGLPLIIALDLDLLGSV